ncbi:MAG: response regulator [Chloroflexi bacterium]|uniref:response regulator n=1 Tax=Candidatus Flexifilum breve TaxID=3140694 RepID=UPI003134F643|nr:response regulator [Chloroflexota bacterium]
MSLTQDVRVMKKHILVVDDEIGALTLIGIMLERGGFEVQKARDAKSALGILEEYTPDLIILDVMMPGMNGIDLCQLLRQQDRTRKTPVLILSARGMRKASFAALKRVRTTTCPSPFSTMIWCPKSAPCSAQNWHNTEACRCKGRRSCALTAASPPLQPV